MAAYVQVMATPLSPFDVATIIRLDRLVCEGKFAPYREGADAGSVKDLFLSLKARRKKG